MPSSRLMVLGPGAAEAGGSAGGAASPDEAAVREQFARHGVPADRLDVAGRGSRAHYLGLHHSIDVALDTFPYNGHTTTLDAAWMGVATVTLAGESHASREGLAVLKLLGMGGLVAGTPGEYAEIAVRLASDLSALRDLRRGLRPRLAASPLCDGPRVARALERAQRGMRRAGRRI